MVLTLIGALIIGLSLGLLGSGGSILTVPLLTYVVGEPAKVAIAESLIIVGGIAIFGAWRYQHQRQIAWPTVWQFGVPSMLGTYGGAYLSQYVSGLVQLSVFAVVMLLASRFMLRPLKVAEIDAKVSLVNLVLAAVIVGVIAGFVGVGGGFLIVPALLLVGGVSMNHAIGTSLCIIVLQSVVGFAKYVTLFQQHPEYHINYTLIGLMIGIGAVGSIGGAKIASNLPQHKLKFIFGLLLVVMGSGIFISSLWRLW
jgi:uncharacterized membrane protein YfcA